MEWENFQKEKRIQLEYLNSAFRGWFKRKCVFLEYISDNIQRFKYILKFKDQYQSVKATTTA